jgi:L-seryl-tRNA(Ser) seleniumtransferase
LRARAVVARAGIGDVMRTDALPGAGSVPGATIDSFGIAVDGDHLGALRQHRPAVIARVHDHRTIIDVRAVDPNDDAVLIAALIAVKAARDG